MQKKMTELYIVDALSFTEAEGRVIKEMSCYLSGEFEVVSEKITNYSEIVMSDNAEADKWYKVKINYIVIDEKTEKEKKTAVYYLVQAKDIDDARRMTNKHMEGTMMDWDCEAVSETKIMDVFLYEADGANKPNEPNKAGGTDKPDKTDKAISKAGKRFVDGIPGGQKVTISATGCEDVVTDKMHGHEEDDA